MTVNTNVNIAIHTNTNSTTNTAATVNSPTAKSHNPWGRRGMPAEVREERRRAAAAKKAAKQAQLVSQKLVPHNPWGRKGKQAAKESYTTVTRTTSTKKKKVLAPVVPQVVKKDEVEKTLPLPKVIIRLPAQTIDRPIEAEISEAPIAESAIAIAEASSVQNHELEQPRQAEEEEDAVPQPCSIVTAVGDNCYETPDLSDSEEDEDNTEEEEDACSPQQMDDIQVVRFGGIYILLPTKDNVQPPMRYDHCQGGSW